MWERFSYYGMRALLTLFMTTATIETNPGLGYDVATAGAIYGLYTSLVYILALPGGWIADNLWGQRKAIWVGGWIIAAGHFTMAIPSNVTFFLGLVFIICGTGLLSPTSAQLSVNSTLKVAHDVMLVSPFTTWVSTLVPFSVL